MPADSAVLPSPLRPWHDAQYFWYNSWGEGSVAHADKNGGKKTKPTKIKNDNTIFVRCVLPLETASVMGQSRCQFELNKCLYMGHDTIGKHNFISIPRCLGEAK